MSYLSNPATLVEHGLVIVGSNIDVDIDGIISVPQSIATDASVLFDEVSTTTALLFDGKQVVTSVTPSSGDGILLSSVTTAGPSTTFTIANTGVLSLTAGPGITIDTSTGNITISATGADLVAVKTVTADYTATADDEYIGVDSKSAVQISLPAGINGRRYTIADEHGKNLGKITISANNTEKINNNSNFVISVPYQSVTVVFNSGDWHII